jgi:hypothetical protein
VSPELAVVQDADRLDALGAVGIARCFTFGGRFRRPLHDPAAAPREALTREAYVDASVQQTTVNHFYEKLFKLEVRPAARWSTHPTLTSLPHAGTRHAAPRQAPRLTLQGGRPRWLRAQASAQRALRTSAHAGLRELAHCQHRRCHAGLRCAGHDEDSERAAPGAGAHGLHA